MKQYLAMWDNQGLEYLYCHSDLEKKIMWNTLKGVPLPLFPNINIMTIRAQANPQRHYEIYTFNADDELTEEAIKLAFESAPQGIVDFIRANGQKIYSDRVEKKPVIV